MQTNGVPNAPEYVHAHCLHMGGLPLSFTYIYIYIDIYTYNALGGRTGPPDPPFTRGGSRPQSASSVPIYKLFNKIPIKQLINQKAGGRLKMSGGAREAGATPHT